MNFSRIRRQFSIFLGDVLILIFNIFLSLLLRDGSVPEFADFQVHFKYLFIPLIVVVSFMYVSNLYSLTDAFSFHKLFLKISVACILGMLIGFAIFYLNPSTPINPRGILFLYSGLSILLLLVWRTLYDRLFFVIHRYKKYIVFGYNNNVQDLLDSTKVKSYINYRPAALFSLEPVHGLDIPVISTLEEVRNFAEKEGVDNFVLSINNDIPSDVKRYMFCRLGHNSHFYSLPDFMEMVCRKIPLGSINEPWIMQNICLDGRLLLSFCKRAFDIFFALIILIVTGIFWPFIALIIKCESRGPVFFKQVREGKNGKTFCLYKFRTMRTEGNNFAMTTKNDSRITAFGNFMRKTRIDELPQALNVLRGDMSVIGPRPERPELAVELEKDVLFYRQRLLVKPGITGWDQVSGEYHSPSVEDTYKKVQFDLYYIKNQSIFLDISILCKTIVTVLKKAGR